MKEAGVGVVYESYIMVDKPTLDNPSAKWTNFTDGSCQRLIHVPNMPGARRYLLGCDAVDCCTEAQSGNHKEYQIPDVHPAWIARVKSLGQQTITLFNGTTLQAQGYHWDDLGLVSTSAYVVGNTLVRWNATAAAQPFVNDYVDMVVPTTPDEITAFKSQFQVPQVCLGTQVPRCGDAKLSAKSRAFLRGGLHEEQVTIPVTMPRLAIPQGQN